MELVIISFLHAVLIMRGSNSDISCCYLWGIFLLNKVYFRTDRIIASLVPVIYKNLISHSLV